MNMHGDMATGGAVEIPEVHVTGSLIPTEELDRVRSSVCLLKTSIKDPGMSWSASGFYVNVKLKKRNGIKDLHCIMTNYHVFQEKKENTDMVAVFHHESREKDNMEIPLVPFKLVASSKPEDLDYVLILVNESLMESSGVKPILADASKLPTIKKDDMVYIVQHPAGMRKHLSHDTVKRVNTPFIEYYADTLKGSSGSPVFVLDKSKFLLVALHSKGVMSYPSNWNKGVLLSEILKHLQTGKVTKPSFPAVPDQIESGIDVTAVGSKDPAKQVTREDIRFIAKDVTDEFWTLGRALGLQESTLKIIDKNNKDDVYQKCHQMLTKWTQIKVSLANYGALSKAFADPTVERQELIEKYCCKW